MRIGLVGLARAAGVLFALGAIGVGCAGDQETLDQVQPGYVKKSDLVGSSWYYRRTVVDAPETMGPYASIGTGDLFTIERIRWEIQENHLVAYRDYEYVPGSEDATLPGNDYVGTPVAAFPIQSHFDIIFQYNSLTGEKTNVRNENITDRQWFERDYMRVDWGKNDNPNYDFLIPLKLAELVTGAGSDTYVHENDAANPFRAHLEPQHGYMDFVVNYYTQPDYQTCYETFDSLYARCTAGEVKVRHAFVKIDEQVEASYRPLYYPDTVTVKDAQGNEVQDPATGEVKREGIFQRFGYYRLDRLTYDKERDLTESGRLYRIIRFDIWEKSVDAAGNEIAYADRTPKPITYYLNADFPAELLPAARDVASDWNQVFKNTVASLQNKPTTSVPDMFILRENNCSVANVKSFLDSHRSIRDDVETAVLGKALDSSTLLNWCAATEYHSRNMSDKFTWQQNGDPRFNMLYWVSNITPSGFSGYGPMFADPMSGRIVSSSAYIMGWTIDAAVTRAVDYIDYMNGLISLTEVMAGDTLPAWFTDTKYDPHAFNLSVDSTQSAALPKASAAHMQSLEARFTRLTANGESPMVELSDGSHFEERLGRVAGTALERDWLTRPEDMIVASHGQWKPGMPVDDELLKEASFFTRTKQATAKRDNTNRMLQERTFCPTAELDGALVGLAKRLKDIPNRDDRRALLRSEIFRAVALHEIGHNVGLRHNFEGSYDALNFNRAFWDMETSGQTELQKEENRQPEFKYSSIMDYHGRTNGDFHGLGKYDNAAIKFGYGQLLETFNDSNIQGGKQLRSWMFANDYRHLPAQLGGVANMNARSDVRFDWTDGVTTDEVNQITAREVPYMFCSDEYAGLTPTCKRFDFGANQREVVAASYVRYKNYFIFSNYLRNRLTVNWAATDRGYSAFRDIVTTYQYMYLYRSMEDKLFNGTPFFETDLGKDMATATANGMNMMAEVLAMPEPNYYYPCVNASTGQSVYYSFGMLNYNPDADAQMATGPNGEQCDISKERYIGVPDSEPLFLDFTDDYVDWTFKYLGTYWDKQAAVMELADPTTVFFRINDIEDRRKYSVSPYRLYDQEILSLMNSLIKYDLVGLASGVDESQQGSNINRTPRLIPAKIVDVDQPVGGVHSPVNGIGSIPRIMPALARNLQRFGVLIGNAYLTSPLDSTLDFSKHTRVVLKGAMDDIDAFDGTNSNLPVAECTLPDSGYTYRAMAVRDGFSIGYNMVQDCATYARNLRTANIAWNAATTDEQRAAITLDINRANAGLARLQQMLQYTRMVHLVYEHGVGL